MTSELSVRLEPGIAEIFRTKASLPHQPVPPSTWQVLDYLAAVRLGARLWFSDGRALWSAPDDVWHFAEHPDVARIIAEHRYPRAGGRGLLCRLRVRGNRGDAVQALPRAFPLGALGDDAMLWLLRWYDIDRGHEYVCTPIVLDAARREVHVLASADRAQIGGTAAKRLLSTGDPHRFLITGQVDAGAMFHLDDFIMVDVAWEVDLTRGTYRDTDNAVGEPTDGLVAVSEHQTLSYDGLDYLHHYATHYPVADTSTFVVQDRAEFLILELHTTGHATVRVAPKG